MKDIEKLSFEEAFAELETLVQEMEAGDLTLNESMQRFERGIALTAHCNTALETAELRVRELAPGAAGDLSPEGYGLDDFDQE